MAQKKIDLTDVWIGVTHCLMLKGELPIEGKIAVFEFGDWKLTINGYESDQQIREGVVVPKYAMLTEYKGKINGLFNIKGGTFAMNKAKLLLDDLNKEYMRLRDGG